MARIHTVFGRDDGVAFLPVDINPEAGDWLADADTSSGWRAEITEVDPQSEFMFGDIPCPAYRMWVRVDHNEEPLQPFTVVIA